MVSVDKNIPFVIFHIIQLQKCSVFVSKRMLHMMFMLLSNIL